MTTESIIKYTENDIERIFLERVRVLYYNYSLKKGTVAEWCLNYPNGKMYASIVCSIPVDPATADSIIGEAICNKKIKEQLWHLCGQYSLITGEKL